MKIRPIQIDGDVAFVTLTKGYFAIIDVADVPLVDGHNWQALCVYRADGSLRTVYATRTNYGRDGKRPIRLHRQIMLPPDHMEIDHIDSDGLNNRRDNMRLATRQQNQHNRRISCDNTSGAKGVSRHVRTNKWQADIRVDGKTQYLGLFACIHEAAAAYAAASKKYHGVFGRTS